MPKIVPPDPRGLPVQLTRAQALDAGLSAAQVQWLVESGRWDRLATGAYLRAWEVPAPADQHEAARAMHRRRAVAAAGRRPGTVVGFASAALLHGLPMVSAPPAQVQLIAPAGGWTGTRSMVRSRSTRLDRRDVEALELEGVGMALVTTVARTWLDIARSQPLTDALSVGDAALRLGLMTIDDVREVLERAGPLRGRPRAVAALPLLSALRESPLESGSAARFHGWGFPEPRLQHSFYDERGFIARGDFDWPEHQVIGFADGMGKYGLDPRRDRAERQQESRLRPQGTVVRWGWVDMAAAGGRGLFGLLAPMLGIDRPFPG